MTGHTGFKGGWLSLWLKKMGAEVTGYALPSDTTPNLFSAARVADDMTSIFGDIRDLATLQAAVQAARPEVVIHMAAQPLVRLSYTQPVETYATNVMGTVHLLESVRQCRGVRAVVSVTTDKCYENREWVWGYREDEPMGGYDPYSNSKGCAELVTSAYRRSYFNQQRYAQHGVAVGSARAGNVIGGGDWAVDRLIPDFVRAISSQQPVRIRSPKATRPWQHVLEPLSGYLVLAQHLFEHGPEYAEAWNFGPADTDARSVEWIVETITRRWGAGARWELESGEQPHEANYLKLDCSKARARMGWVPRWRLGQALDRIVDWHQAQLRGEDMREHCLKQIEEYECSPLQIN
jgi:CDP-glucose 4,6-dehydratase